MLHKTITKQIIDYKPVGTMVDKNLTDKSEK